MTKKRAILIGWLLLIAAMVTPFVLIVLDVTGAKYKLAQGMTKSQVFQFYGNPDEQNGTSFVFWQGGHNVELEFHNGVVIKVQVILCD